MIACGQCGFQELENSRFCSKCGISLPTVYSSSTRKVKSHVNRDWIGFGFVALFVILVIAGMAANAPIAVLCAALGILLAFPGTRQASWFKRLDTNWSTRRFLGISITLALLACVSFFPRFSGSSEVIEHAQETPTPPAQSNGASVAVDGSYAPIYSKDANVVQPAAPRPEGLSPEAFIALSARIIVNSGYFNTVGRSMCATQVDSTRDMVKEGLLSDPGYQWRVVAKSCVSEAWVACRSYPSAAVASDCDKLGRTPMN